jgi:3',5'-cyclic AMP phosphodiesterase CpdA
MTAADPVTFVHLSDTHIGPRETRPYGTDTAANLRAVADRVREMALEPAFFVFSGDLSDHGQPESYTHFGEIVAESFAPFGAPVLLGLGNHDTRIPFRQVILGQTAADDETAPYFYSQPIGDLRVLMLDSKIPDEVHGLLGEQQLAWLAAELATPAPGGDLVVLHHPCVPRGVPRADDYLLLDAADLADVLTRTASAHVLALLCGHSHVSTTAVFAGHLHVAAAATAYLLDPSIRDGGRAVEGAGFNICTVRDARVIVNPVTLPGGQRELYRHFRTFTGLPAPTATPSAA